MSFSVIIPARFASQRLPGKPLQLIAGKTMIERVYECASRSAAKRVIVATDDQRVHDNVRAFGGDVVMTSQEHQSGTDRLQEVVSQLWLQDEDIVVNVQGDEPLIPAAVINQVAHNLSEHPDAAAATLCEPIALFEDLVNPNVVKVVCDHESCALYFSRAPIPWDREGYGTTNASPHVAARRHIGIYAYRVSLLHQFVKWPLAPLESIERLEQLRIIANGQKIHVQDACEAVPGGVDTQEDLARICKLFKDSGKF